MSHQRGEIVEFEEEPRKVNMLRGVQLYIPLYIVDNRLYKRLKNGKYRSLVLQTKRPEFNHYFMKDKDKRKLTLNVHKLDLLTWSEPKIELKKDSVHEL